MITEAGNDPKVAGLVYITAFAPDKGESVATLIKDPPPGGPVPPILPPQDGYLFLDKAKFPASFAADVDAEKAAFMADSQVPWGMEALSGTISEPAWKSKPSWYLVATEDKMIPPDAQRAMSKRAGSTVVEVKGSHAIYVSQPESCRSSYRTSSQECEDLRRCLITLGIAAPVGLVSLTGRGLPGPLGSEAYAITVVNRPFHSLTPPCPPGGGFECNGDITSGMPHSLI